MVTKKVRVVVDSDVAKKYSIRNPSQVEFYVVTYLNDPDGWSKFGYFFEPVEFNEDVLIHLASTATIDKKCGNVQTGLSCAELGGKLVYLNSERWFNGSKKSGHSLENYRQYMVSHEIGHILGHGHKKCPCKDCAAPIMMQQTLGLERCKPNTNVY